MKLYEALDEGYRTLNSGGVPVILTRSKDGVRVYDVRLRWTGNEDPRSSARGPMIIESRERTLDRGWTEWKSNPTPFSVDDLLFSSSWDVDYPDHVARSGYPCGMCAENDLRTDDAMEKFYGPRKHRRHACGLKAFYP